MSDLPEPRKPSDAAALVGRPRNPGLHAQTNCHHQSGQDRCALAVRALAEPIIESLPSIRLLPAQYPFNSLLNWHFEILFIVTIIIQLIHIVLEALYINNPVVAFGMIGTP